MLKDTICDNRAVSKQVAGRVAGIAAGTLAGCKVAGKCKSPAEAIACLFLTAGAGYLAGAAVDAYCDED